MDAVVHQTVKRCGSTRCRSPDRRWPGARGRISIKHASAWGRSIRPKRRPTPTARTAAVQHPHPHAQPWCEAHRTGIPNPQRPGSHRIAPPRTSSRPAWHVGATPVAIPPKPAAPGVGRRSDASRDHGARNPHHPGPAAAIATCVAPTETRNAPGLGARATPVAIPPKLAAPGVGRRSDASRDHGARNPRHPAWPPPSRLASLPQEPATLPALTHERRQSRSPQNPQRPGWDVGATPVAITTPGIRTTPARPP